MYGAHEELVVEEESGGMVSHLLGVHEPGPMEPRITTGRRREGGIKGAKEGWREGEKEGWREVGMEGRRDGGK